MSDAEIDYIFVGIRGTVLAIRRSNGAVVWKAALKGAGFVNIVLDKNDLIATTKGEVFCIAPRTGVIRWNNPMSGFGYGLATIAVPGSTQSAAMAEHQFQQEAAAAGAGATAGSMSVSAS